MEKFDLKKYLIRHKNTNIDFYRFPGNYGDSFIWHGTIKLLEQLNIVADYTELDSNPLNDVLLIDGGGNLVDYYSDVRNFLEKKKELYKEIIILPHTIYGENQKKLLNSFNNNVVIFCREMISYTFAKKYATKCQVYLWHDCAFYNDFSNLSVKGKGILNAYRKDIESARDKIPEDNSDLSYNGYAKKPLDNFLNRINEFEVVNTDRLHVGIVAALLGKTVNLYSNSYFKNHAVYEYSMSRFPNVKFIETL